MGCGRTVSVVCVSAGSPKGACQRTFRSPVSQPVCSGPEIAPCLRHISILRALVFPLLSRLPLFFRGGFPPCFFLKPRPALNGPLTPHSAIGSWQRPAGPPHALAATGPPPPRPSPGERPHPRPDPQCRPPTVLGHSSQVCEQAESNIFILWKNVN